MNLDRDNVEERVVRALGARPVVVIPEHFARRVAGQVPAGVAAARREIPASSFGSRMAVVVAAILLLTLMGLAQYGLKDEMMRWLELALAIEFAALTSWLGLRPVLRSR